MVILFPLFALAQQKVIPLYNGPAPGSESWSWQEKEIDKNPFGYRYSYNVTQPSLKVYSPDSTQFNHAAILVIPGGGFRVLNIENEGSKIAHELTKKGYLVFVLSYRLTQSVTADPWQEMMDTRKVPAKSQTEIASTKKLAIEDAKMAMRYIRKNAKALNIDSNRVGCVGFSAGGSLAMELSISPQPEIRPNCSGIIYSTFKADSTISLTHVPPVFIAVASDDKIASPVYSTQLYTDLLKAGKSPELHIFSLGGHGLRLGHSPSWIHRFIEWLKVNLI